MNAAQFHLALNHFPVVLVTIATLLLVWGQVRSSSFGNRAGLILAVLAGLFAVPAFLTGEPAEEVIESRAGVSEALIEEHEEAADWGLGLVLASGALALGSALLLRRDHPKAKLAIRVTLAATLVATAALGRVAHLGGLIRHEEIRPDAASSVSDE